MGIIGTPQLIDAEFHFDGNYTKSYRRTYRVFSTVDVDEHYVGSNLGITIYNTHPSNVRAVVQGIDLKLESPVQASYDAINNPGGAGSPPANGTPCYVWIASIEYGPWNPLEHTATGDPANQPVQVYFEGQTFQVPAEIDVDGNPVENSANCPFDPAPVRDQSRPVLRIIRNEPTFSGSTVVAYADKVNLAALGPYAARTLKLAAPKASPKYSQFTGNIYYEVEYIANYDPNTWDLKVLDAGYDELDPSDATKRRQIKVEGQPASSPQLLDGSGHALVAPVDHANVHYVVRQVYETLDFDAAFSFPTGTFT